MPERPASARLFRNRGLLLTTALSATQVFGLVAGRVSLGAVTIALVPDDARGRVAGIAGAMAVVSIPFSALLGGWLADLIGVTPLFAVGGTYVLAIAALAWANPHLRTARIEGP